MGIPVDVESTVGVPVVESMAPRRRGVGVPFGTAGTDIVAGIVRVVLHGDLGVELPYVATVPAVRAEYDGYAFGIRVKGVVGPGGHAVVVDSATFGIHPGEEHPAIGAAQGAGAGGPAEDHGLTGESIEPRGVGGIGLPVLRSGEIRVIPEGEGLIAELVGEYIDDVGSGGLPAAAGNGKGAEQWKQWFNFRCHIRKVKNNVPKFKRFVWRKNY